MVAKASPVPSAQSRSQSVALRRGLVLLGMTLIVPGSAQLAAGNVRIGRWAVRIWLSLVGLALLFVLLLLVARPSAISLYANVFSLEVLRWGSYLLGAAMLLLLADAWWIANPRAMSRRGKIVSGSLAGVLALAVAISSGGIANAFSVQSSLIGTMFSGGGTTEQEAGRYNVLLLGGDAGASRWGLRPDTMIVASIDAQTGRTVLFSLPRNLQWAPFPETSPLHKLYPNGFWCKDQSCLLNAVYTLALNHKNLYPGVKYPGVQATKEVIENILGLKINYWAMIDLAGFESLINAVGGITLDVAQKVPIGGGLNLETGHKYPITGYVGPGTNLHLDGHQALWFARSREGSTDYVRMARQKCVLNAMVHQLNPMTVLTKFNDIAAASKELVATDLPASQIGTMLDLAQRGKSLPIGGVSFAPPLIRPVKPDFAKIRQIVIDQIAASQAAGTSTATPTPAATDSPSAGASSTPKTKPTSTAAIRQTDDLDSVCKVSH